MIAKIKLLAKKAIDRAKICWVAVAEKIRSSQILNKCIQKLQSLARKLAEFVKTLWMTKENRLLLLLIGAVLVLLVLAVILFFGVDWNKTVGICYRDDADPSNAAYRQVLEQSLAKEGYSVIVADADSDQARQLEQIGQMAQHQCDAIIVEPVMISAGEELSQAIAAAGTPCVLIGRQPESGAENIPCVISDTGTLGTLLGQMVAELPDSGDINGDGVVTYLLLHGTEQNTEGTRLTEGVTAAFSGNQIQPQLMSAVWGKWTKDGAQQACSQALAAYGKDIEVILCMNDAMALGVVDAIADGGRSVGADVYLYSIGGQEEACRAVQSGQMTGTLYTDLQQQADAVISAILAQLSGKEVRTVSRAEYFRVTQENVGQYLPQND